MSGNTTISGNSILDWDGQGGGATTVVTGTGNLTINADRIDADDLFDGTIRLEDNSRLSVTVDDGRWDMTGVSSLAKSTAGTSTLSGSNFTMAGDVDVTAGTLQVDSNIVFGGAPRIAVANGAEFRLNGTGSFTNTAMTIDGTLQLNGNMTWNGGGNVTGSGKIVNEGSSRFTANKTIAVATFDWDQGNSTIEEGAALDVNVNRIDTNNDTFNANTISVNGGTLIVSVNDGQWDLADNSSGRKGILELRRTGSGQIPTLNGDRLNVQDGGEIKTYGSEVDINAPITLQTGGVLAVQDATVVNLDGPTTLAGGNITSNIGGARVVQDGNLTVTGNSTITTTTYDWDEGETTVEPNGSLNLNVTGIEATGLQKYDRTITLNSGDVDVDLASNVWTMDGTLRLNNTSDDVPNLSGDSLFVGDGSGSGDAIIQVGGRGTSRISATTFYESDADIDVSENAILEHAGMVTYRGGGVHGGDGAIKFRSHVTFEGSTSLNLTSSTDFTPSGDSTANLVTINAPVSLNTGALLFGGSVASGAHRIAVHTSAGGSLDVNTSSGDWSVLPGAILELNGDSTLTTLLSGSTLELQGTMNVAGAVQVESRHDIAGTVNVSSSSDQLQLAGGTFARPDLLSGGSIQGSGTLRLPVNGALYGYGSISTTIQADASAQLFADDGDAARTDHRLWSRWHSRRRRHPASWVRPNHFKSIGVANAWRTSHR